MDDRIHFFSHIDVISKKVDPVLLGIRGRQANEFAELGFPILPGFILDSRLMAEYDKADIRKDLKTMLGKCSGLVGKTFGDDGEPMLLKVVVSTNLAVSNYPTLHNFGLVRSTITGFAKFVGENFAAHEVLFLVRGMLRIEERIAELEKRESDRKKAVEQREKLEKELASDHPSKSASAFMDEYAFYLPQGFFDSAFGQLEITLKEICRLLKNDDQNDGDTALMVQPMVYGNYGKDSCSGYFNTRDVVTGEKKLQGEFFREKFNEIGANGQDISKVGDQHVKDLQKIAWMLEDRFKEIRQIRFTVEKGKLWLIEQRAVDAKSTQADIRLLLDLAKRKIVEDAYIVKAIEPGRLNEILHPIIDKASTKG
ncbi:MAG: pyruvate, phosphate dikinase, partial [Treponemataceae bacterium]